MKMLATMKVNLLHRKYRPNNKLWWWVVIFNKKPRVPTVEMTMIGRTFIEHKRISVLVPEIVEIEEGLVLLIQLIFIIISSIMFSSRAETANKEPKAVTQLKTNLISNIMRWSPHSLEVLQLIDLPSCHQLFKRIHPFFQKELVLVVLNLTPYLDHNLRAF